MFCMFLVISMPFAFCADTSTDLSLAGTDEEIGENLAIEVQEYQPTVVPSSLIEEQSIPIRVVLGAIRTSAFDIPKNIRVRLELLDERTVSKKNSSLSGTSKTIRSNYYRSNNWNPNSYPTLDNLGYLEIWLKKIPKEADVPESIDLDFRAHITYEAETTELSVGGNPTLNLPVESEDTFEFDDEHMIWNGAGYFRVVSATDDKITLHFYDYNYQKKHSFSISKGKTSGRKSIKGHPIYEYFRVKYNGMTDESFKVKFNIDGDSEEFSKGETVVGEWDIKTINKDDDYVILKNSDDVEIPLVDSYSDIVKNEKTKTKYAFNRVEDLLGIIEEQCKENDEYVDCMIYRSLDKSVSEDFGDKEYSSDEVETFKEGLVDLDGKYLDYFEGFGSGITKVKILIGDDTYSFEKEESGFLKKLIGGSSDVRGETTKTITGDCDLSSIGRGYVVVEYIEAGDDKGEKQTLHVGDSIDEDKFHCGDSVEFLGEFGVGDASFTVLAGSGVGESVSDFSIHIPIEKRLWNLTADEIDNQINKTKENIEKLNETIEKLDEIVKGWTKVCLAVAAVFTVWSFLGGLGGKGTGAAPKLSAKQQTVDKPDEKNLYYQGDDYSWKKLEGDKIYRDEEGNCYSSSEKIYGNRISCSAFRTGTESEKYTYYTFDDDGKLEPSKGPGTFTKSRSSAMYGDSIVFGYNGDVTVPIHKKSALPKGNCQNEYEKFINANGAGSAVFMHWDKSEKDFKVFHGGYDNELNHFKNPGKEDDRVLCYFSESSDEGKIYSRNLGKVVQAKNSGDQKVKFEGHNYEINNRYMKDVETLNCEDVMSEGQCLILYNACDPVICPSSRCNFGGQYYVENVIQSGLIGSTMLCLPNIKQGVVMPVCLSGILASLKTIKSVLEGYVSCLEAAKVTGKSIGICDKIRSIYICEIIWKEVLTFLKMSGGIVGSLLGSAQGKGGGEYLKGGFDAGGRTLDFFTDSYAKNVFAAYKGRASKEIGTEICKAAIYGKTPFYGDIVEEISSAQNPPQFTVYFEEHTYSTIGKVQSRYQVYYHIYAGGKDITYKIYLRKDSRTETVGQGRISSGDMVDESIDILADSGYPEICARINDRDYCGFGKVVSTSFALTAINDYMMGRSMGQKIESESECRATNAGLDEYIPNAQVTRVCSITDPTASKNDGEKWIIVGTCGKDSEGRDMGDCWEEISAAKPSVRSAASQGSCESINYYVCKSGETCDHAQKETMTVGDGYKNIICCPIPCVADSNYASLKSDISSFVGTDDSGVYGKMESWARNICEKSSVAHNDPFKNAESMVSGWTTLENGIDELDNANSKTIAHNYFKGMMYLLCKDCTSAKDIFERIPKDNEFYTKAKKSHDPNCENLKLGEVVASAKKVTSEKTDGDKETLKIEDKYIELNIVNSKIVENVYFESNVDLKKCEIILERNDESEPYTLKTEISGDKTICTINELPLFLNDKFTLKVELVPEDEDTYETFKKDYTITNTEKKVTSENALLCEVIYNNELHYFCLGSFEDNENKRCGDIYHTTSGKYGKIIKEMDDFASCVAECSSDKYNAGCVSGKSNNILSDDFKVYSYP